MSRFKVNATIYWASLNRVNDLSGKYQMDVGGLSDAAVERMQQVGVEARNKDDERGNFVTIKSAHPIKAYNTEGEEILDIVGNGSKAEVIVTPYDWTFKNKQGVSLSCLKLIITDLNVFEAVGNIDEDLEEAL